MKRKIFNILIALVLLLGMSLVMATPAAAAVTGVTVTVNPTTVTTADADYTIVFTSTVALTDAVDAIDIIFPTGTTVAAITGTVNTHAITASSILGQRVSITIPASAGITAGSTVTIVLTAGITNPATGGSNTLKVYTSLEPVEVTSAAYLIGSTPTTVTTVTNTPTAVNTAAEYVITFQAATVLVIDTDTITVTFPSDTTVPATIAAADVLVSDHGEAFVACNVAPTISGRAVTLTTHTGVTAGAGSQVKFLVTAGIKNPTTIGTSWTVSLATSKDIIAKTSSGAYSTTNAPQANITQIAWKTVDAYIPLNTASSAFVIETRDMNGVPATVTGVTTFLLTSGTGVFYSDPACTLDIGTITIADGASASANFYYKSTTAGTKSLTVSEVVAHSPVWTPATTTVIVNPLLELWGGGVLRGSYATFALAIAAALPYDTIKVYASTYEEGTIGVHTVHHLTIQSVSGAATTIIRGPAGTNKLFEIGGATSDTADGFVLDGFTLSGTFEYGVYMYVRGFNIKNNIITGPASDGIFVTNPTTGPPTDINSGTINNNVITGKGTAAMEYRPGIGLEANDAASAAIHGITISNNTISGFGTTTFGVEAAGIRCATVHGMGLVSDITITGNILTGNRIGLHIYGSCTGLIIYSNTMSANKEGVVVCNSATDAIASTFSLCKNTITGNTVNGVHILQTGSETISGVKSIMYNDITLNGVGMQNDFSGGTAPVVTHNYWGSATGPLNTTTNPSGAGNAVSAYLIYSPWLYASQATVVASGKSQYATSVILANKATLSDSTYSGGWNTFSTPITLDSSADTWSDIKTLTGLTSRIAAAYAWDGIAWATPTDITPLNAIFVQLTPGASISLPILYSTTLMPAATRTMHATVAGSYTGWELVGQANLTNQTQAITLASIATKYSQVIDPISGLVIASVDNMVVGAGYWVFITTGGTLAGFSVTPVPFVPVP